MKAKWIKKSLCILCILCLNLAAVATAQNEAPSVLDRVQNVDDPELGELVQAAIENQAKLSSSQRTETMELIRKVTLSYTQIKLFDQQIAEVSRKIKKAATGPAEMQYELLLAKAELEAKQMTELANLRELMGIIPKHAFDKKPIKSLSSWVILRVLDKGVYVLDTLQPFRNYWARRRYKSSGLQSEKEVLDYVQEKLKDPNNLPVRIDHSYTAEMSSAAKDLHGKVVSLIREANCQMEAEVNLELIENVGTGESMFFLRNGTISTLHPGGAPLKRPDGTSKPLVTGVVEPNDLEQHIMWRFMHPKNVPLKFRIEHDEASAKLARQTADKVRAVAKDLGISELVEVERILVETVHESAFLGQWQAITKGEILAINIQPTGVCVLTMSDRYERYTAQGAIKAGASVPGRWFLTLKEIFMDIKDYHQGDYYVYQGHFDKQGNLVVSAGLIHTKGIFYPITQPTVFEKVY